MKFFKKINKRIQQQIKIFDRLDSISEALGRIESRINSNIDFQDLSDCEFKVYSQWGEDGIIDYLCQNIPIANRYFIEFGVENYTEANTLFLLKHRNWRGLIIDGSSKNIDSIISGGIYWRYDLKVSEAFITRENINEIIENHGIRGEIGLLSVDIDGNDYWVWDAINCVNPAIVVCEYNSLFGSNAMVTIPYDSNFYRTRAHSSNLFYGASISALNYLANSRGFVLVAGNSVGNNAFFVRKDLLGNLKERKPDEVYVKAGFRETRSSGGRVELLTFEERQNQILDLPVIQVDTMAEVLLRDALM